MTDGAEGSGGHAAKPALFESTHWSVVLRAKDQSETALASLCETYRQPLLVWLRIKGYSPDDAEDIVHGCLHDLLRRNFLQNVSRDKGRFRTFLLACLKHHLRDQHDRQMADKRGHGQPIESLDETDVDGRQMRVALAAESGPDREFDRAWAQTVLTSALRRLSAECARQGHGALFQAIEPALFSAEDAASYREIGVGLDMSEAAVKMAAHRIRARLKGLVREEVLQTVANENDWRDEIRYLIELFGPP